MGTCTAPSSGLQTWPAGAQQDTEPASEHLAAWHLLGTNLMLQPGFLDCQGALCAVTTFRVMVEHWQWKTSLLSKQCVWHSGIRDFQPSTSLALLSIRAAKGSATH
jgi:hypothetical protein